MPKYFDLYLTTSLKYFALSNLFSNNVQLGPTFQDTIWSKRTWRCRLLYLLLITSSSSPSFPLLCGVDVSNYETPPIISVSDSSPDKSFLMTPNHLRFGHLLHFSLVTPLIHLNVLISATSSDHYVTIIELTMFTGWQPTPTTADAATPLLRTDLALSLGTALLCMQPQRFGTRYPSP